MTKEIDWNSPVVGKLEVGKTYVDRSGVKRTIDSCDGSCFTSVATTWLPDGCYHRSNHVRHVYDLISEYQPPAPLRMWMNVNSVDCRRFFTSKDNAIHNAIYTVDLVRTAVPVEVTEITEGH